MRSGGNHAVVAAHTPSAGPRALARTPSPAIDSQPLTGRVVGEVVALAQVLNGVPAFVAAAAPGLGAEAGPALLAVDILPIFEMVAAAEPPLVARQRAGGGVLAAVGAARALERDVTLDNREEEVFH